MIPDNAQRYIPDSIAMASMVTIYGLPLDSDCITTRMIAESHGFDVEYLTLNEDYDLRELYSVAPDAKTFPQIVLDGWLIGDGHDFVDFINETIQRWGKH